MGIAADALGSTSDEGDRRVDFAAVKKLLSATYVSQAVTHDAERLAGSVAGTVPPPRCKTSWS